ncbi:ATP-binding protein [Streptomyces sp. NPDC048845]|uniref:ATP-binding protein n=1 Tax=Streptomyces sp. NPDC048845 TaxID=3155390 RepID=UPI00344A7460
MTTLSKSVLATSTGRPAYSQTLPCEPSTAETGRRLVRNVLDVWGLDDLTDRALLIVTELISNAAKHTSCGEIRLTVGRPSVTRVRVGVLDWEPSRLPTVGRADENDESGRGLLLIDAVADRWGYDLHGSHRRPRSKELWAELHIENGA